MNSHVSLYSLWLLEDFKLQMGLAMLLCPTRLPCLESWTCAAAVSDSVFWEHCQRLSTELGCEQTLVSICLAVMGEDELYSWPVGG